MGKSNAAKFSFASAFMLFFLAGMASAQTANPSFVSVQSGQLYLNSQPFYFSGTNAYYLNTYEKINPSYVTQSLDLFARNNITVVRMWGFQDGTDCGYWPGDPVLQVTPGVYNESALQLMDSVVKKAKDRQLRLIISFVNFWGDLGGICQYNKWAGYNGSQNPTHDEAIFFHGNANTKQWYKNYVSAILNRVNTQTGVAYKDEPAIMAWELANEDMIPSESDPSILRNWYREMAQHIKSIDSTHLVTTGEQGFEQGMDYVGSPYSRNLSNTYVLRAGEGTSFMLNTQIPEIDFAQIHIYPDAFGFSTANNYTAWIADSITYTNDHARIAQQMGKPMIIGEYGSGYYTGWDADSAFKQRAYPAWWSNNEQNANVSGDLLWQFAIGVKCTESGGNICATRDPILTQLLNQHGYRMRTKSSSPPPADTTEPTVSISSPANGSTVSGTITIAATASDNVAVAGVQFRLDGAALGSEDTSSPYSASWNTATATNGFHNLTATARDSAGNSRESAVVRANVNNAAIGTLLIANHTSVDSFSQIPDAAVSAASAFRTMLRHASVGSNIDSGLNALYSQNSKYNRSAWQFQNRGNPTPAEKIADFVNSVNANRASFEAMGMKFCFIDDEAVFAPYRDAMDGLETSYPAEKIVWWTMPITTGDGASSVRAAFNSNVRAHVRANGKILYDLADIESHRADGSACTYNGYEALCSDWSLDGGHLNAAGSQRAAQAYWHLVARLAGWDGSAGSGDTTLPSVSITSPANNSVVNGTITIAATASDNVAVAGVQFRLDGAALGSEDTSSPYSASWNTATATNGFHNLTATARDSAGNSRTSAAVRVTVSNAPSSAITIMPLGDSITEYNWQGGYRAQLYKLLIDNGANFDFVGVKNNNHDQTNLGFVFPQAYWDHEGYNSATITRAAGTTWIWNENIASQLAANPPKTVLVLLGTNDLVQRTGAAVRGDMSAFLDQIWAFDPNINVVLGAPPPSRVVDHNSRVNDYVALLPALVSEKAALGRKIVLANHNAVMTTADLEDNYHPSPAGFVKMAQVWYGALAQLQANASDPLSPNVSITSPANNSMVNGTISIAASASDNVGVAGVQFRLDGVNIGAEDTSSPYSYSWNTSTTANGIHNLTAVARDAAGNSRASAVVRADVSNPVPPAAPGMEIYSETALNSPWTFSQSYGGTNNPANTNPVYAGSTSLAASYRGWGDLNLRYGEYWTTLTIDPRQYSSLDFAVHGGTNGVLLRVALGARDASGASSRFVQYRQVSVPANSWAAYSFPMSELDSNNTPFNDIGFTLYQSANATFYLDSIRLTGRGGANNTTVPSTIAVNYNQSSENFLNPERGFFGDIIFGDATCDPGRGVRMTPATVSELVNQKNTYNVSLMFLGFESMCTAVSRNFTQSELDLFSNSFSAVRGAGMKAVFRFSYTQTPLNPQASLPQMLAHLEQLRPIFQQNKDVIAFVQAGFVGAWGEWHDSPDQVFGGSINWTNRDNYRALLYKLLDVVPVERNVQVRTPYAKELIFNTTETIPQSLAFTGDYRARTGHHNDCLFSSSIDGGTYSPSAGGTNPYPWGRSIDQWKSYLASENQYVAHGGETCGTYNQYSACSAAIPSMAQLHWTYLNRLFSPSVLNGWIADGCMPEIYQRLGYRLSLSGAAFQSTVAPGSTMRIQLNITNTGFASPVNGRMAQLIIRAADGTRYYARLPVDPRTWLGGTTTPIDLNIGVPASVPSGNYELLMHLPDPEPSIYNRPEYAIRLANPNTWESSTGYNKLLANVTVSPTGQTSGAASVSFRDTPDTTPIPYAYVPDTTAPSVSITTPANNSAVNGTITIAATASDNVAVAGVQFLLDGAALGAEDTSSPYSYSWNTSTAANGWHNLSATARDAAGNSRTVALRANVSNAAVIPPPVVYSWPNTPMRGIGIGSWGFSSSQLTEADFIKLKGWNVNIVRLHVKGIPAAGDLERVLDLAEQYDIKVVIALMCLADTNACTSSPTTYRPWNYPYNVSFWSDFSAQDGVFAFWDNVTRRAKDRGGVVAGYDLLNEPAPLSYNDDKFDIVTIPGSPNDLGYLYSRLIQSVRAIDPSHTIIIESRCNGQLCWKRANTASPYQYAVSMPIVDESNIVYSFHWYNPLEYTHQGVGTNPLNDSYPGNETNRGYFDATRTRNEIMKIRDFAQANNAKIFMGEYSVASWAANGSNWLYDVTSAFDEFGFSSTYHHYDEYSGWNLEVGSPDRLNVMKSYWAQAGTPPDTAAPSVTVSHSPPSPNSTQNVTFTANASDASGIRQLQISVDGGIVRTCAYATACSYIGGPYAAGSLHTYYAAATDNSTNLNIGRNPLSGTRNFTVQSAPNATNNTTDTIAPNVSITSPANGSSLWGTLAVAASASDNVGVAGVQFRLDGSNLGAEDTSPPYAVSWNTSFATNGWHNLSATARDSAGNRRNASAIRVNVANSVANNSTNDTTRPSVGVSHSPAQPTVSDSVAITATAADASGIRQIRIFVDGSLSIACGVSPCSTFAAKYSQGTHTYYAIATDASSNNNSQSSATYNFTVTPAGSGSGSIGADGGSSGGGSSGGSSGDSGGGKGKGSKYFYTYSKAIKFSGADINLTRTIEIGENNITYVTLKITNGLYRQMKNFRVRDRMPSKFSTDASEISFSIQPEHFETGSIIAVWRFGLLDPGESLSLTYSVPRYVPVKGEDFEVSIEEEPSAPIRLLGLKATLFAPDKVTIGQEITLYVADENSNPVSGAMVTVTNPEKKQVNYLTDAKGEVKFTPALEGSYQYSTTGVDNARPTSVSAKPNAAPAAAPTAPAQQPEEFPWTTLTLLGAIMVVGGAALYVLTQKMKKPPQPESIPGATNEPLDCAPKEGAPDYGPKNESP